MGLVQDPTQDRDRTQRAFAPHALSCARTPLRRMRFRGVDPRRRLRSLHRVRRDRRVRVKLAFEASLPKLRTFLLIVP